ncbi:glycerophosphodiester phosphodiesterase [Bosea sp. BH3]|uniref:glycerophosphodiester phosphodiesterase n=1 Tax=Bosea sp. BH3 TaxID=2871701 RepID=UPI0021CB4E2E|nr:glycerophosphodiester phosphodiesterase [Bosea sp. BH3]MCU4181892.1 glycerophosphodiester phosphodiesterase [Bosea sp. BH3]
MRPVSVFGAARPLAIAHRGGALLGPENTAQAFRASIEAGAEIVETDVRLSADGALVCLHDADLARLTGDPRRVAETDLATLRALLPGLMTLDEAIFASAPLGLLLDVKLHEPRVLNPILAALDTADAAPRGLLGLRDIELIAAARRLSPQIAILALVPDPDSIVAARSAGADLFRLWQGHATPERLAAVHEAGMGSVIMVGQPRSVAEPGYPPFPVGRIDQDGIARVLALGPDAVMLDDPRLLLSTRTVTGPSSI